MRCEESLKIGYNAMMQLDGKSIEEANAWYVKEMCRRDQDRWTYPDIVPNINEYVKGRKVAKNSKNPFLSTNRVNTITGICKHPYKPGSYAYSFEEDNSVVEIYICRFI